MSSDAPKATARKVLLNSGSRKHGERFPLDGSKPLPDAIPEDEDDDHRDTGAFGGVKPAPPAMSIAPPAAAAQQPEQPAPPPQEPTMPRGQYDRSKSKKRKAKKSHEAVAPDASPATRKKRAKKVAPQPADTGHLRFAIDDRGGMSVRDDSNEITFTKDDVVRLEGFLENTKAMRA